MSSKAEKKVSLLTCVLDICKESGSGEWASCPLPANKMNVSLLSITVSAEVVLNMANHPPAQWQVGRAAQAEPPQYCQPQAWENQKSAPTELARFRSPSSTSLCLQDSGVFTQYLLKYLVQFCRFFSTTSQPRDFVLLLLKIKKAHLPSRDPASQAPCQ